MGPVGAGPLRVGTTGFEPATSPTPRVRATGLRYAPNRVTRYHKAFLGARVSNHMDFSKTCGFCFKAGVMAMLETMAEMRVMMAIAHSS